MEQDPTRICELLVGLGDVNVVGVDDEATEPLVVHIQTRTRSRPVCSGCGGLVRPKAPGRCGWWICRCSGVRCACCGTSIAGSARPQIVRQVHSPKPTTRSRRRVRR